MMSNFCYLLVIRTCLLWLFLHNVSGVFPRSSNLPSATSYVEVIEEWNLVPWLNDDIKFGQVSGVSIDPDENIYLFHRADRVWDDKSFTREELYTGRSLGPISQPTILVFNSDGKLLNKLGKDMFFLPHGITVDSEFNIWITDVALHQVMKLSPHSNNASLTLGEKFMPGLGPSHFCKPTSVAVVSNGDFFVADGYCNSRILKYNSEGKKLIEWGRETSQYHPPGKYDLFIPHALTLAEDQGVLCTADRENGRVVCYKIENGDYVTQFSSSVMGKKIFSVAYSSIAGGRFYMVNGKSSDFNIPVQGVVLDTSAKIVGKFGNNLHTPHDLAVSSNGNTIYVVEISPYKAWKYQKKDCSTASPDSPNEGSRGNSFDSKSVDNVEGLTGAVLVTISCFIFAFGLFMAVLIYSKSRRSASSDTRRLLSNIDY